MTARQTPVFRGRCSPPPADDELPDDTELGSKDELELEDDELDELDELEDDERDELDGDELDDEFELNGEKLDDEFELNGEELDDDELELESDEELELDELELESDEELELELESDEELELDELGSVITGSPLRDRSEWVSDTQWRQQAARHGRAGPIAERMNLRQVIFFSTISNRRSQLLMCSDSQRSSN